MPTQQLAGMFCGALLALSWFALQNVMAEESCAGPIHWQTLAEGQKSALAQKRPMLIFFPGIADTWHCTYCLRYEQTSFADKRIVKLLAEQLVPVFVKLHVEAAVAEKFSVEYRSTVLVVTPGGRVIGRSERYLSSDQLERFINDSLAVLDSDPRDNRVVIIKRW